MRNIFLITILTPAMTLAQLGERSSSELLLQRGDTASAFGPDCGNRFGGNGADADSRRNDERQHY